MDNALNIIGKHAEDSMKLIDAFFRANAENIRLAAFKIALCLARNGKVLICGNGGSAADAQHLAGEFVNRFLIDRPALPALALTTDTSVLTAISNDYDFEQIFSRQTTAFGQPGDTLLAISTSGNSRNVLNALNAARERGLFNIGLCGMGGGGMAALCDILIEVPEKRTPLVQEMHIAAEHLICQLVDYYLFENVEELSPWLTGEKNKG